MRCRTAILAMMMGLGLASAAQADSGRDGHRGERQWRGEHRHQGHDHDGRRSEHRREHRGEHRQHLVDRDHHRQGDARRWEHRRDWQAHQHAPRYYAPQHQPRVYNHVPSYGHGHAYHGAPQYRVYNHSPRYWAGGYVPHHYRSNHYWVNDWHARHLSAPPYGHQWVQTDTGEILLIALATGLIAHALFNAY